MSSKKETILKLLDEGKNIEDLVITGYNKKYVKEVIRNSKGRNEEKNSKGNLQSDTQNDIAQIRNDISDIKDFLESSHWNSCQNVYANGEKNNRQTVLDLMRVLQFLENNEQLLNSINLEVKICIGDSKQTSRGSGNEIHDIDGLNPIEIYRDKGEEKLSNILHQYDIAVLKEIARRYTPDSRGYVYKWMDIDKIINFIIERAEKPSKKGSVFVTD